MKYAALVLYDKKNPVLSVDFPAVTDALLAGGVFLDEVEILPYDAPSSVTAALTRMSDECEGVFAVCDPALLVAVREVALSVSGGSFGSEYLLETDRTLFAVLPAGDRGADAVRTEVVPRIDARRRNRFSRVVLRTVGAPA